MIDLNQYFKRINYVGSSTPTIDTLRTLHRAHLLSVPFENLDIHLGREIILAEDRIFDKIVGEGRGGFCYEQNGLFCTMLREMGFSVDMLQARVYRDDGSKGIPFGHMALRVRLEDDWLADVGFGASFREPLRLNDESVQDQAEGSYRLMHAEAYVDYFQEVNGEWMKEFRLYLEPRTLADFAGGCTYQQTSPDSHFTQRRVCSLATESGRITITDNRFIVTENGNRKEEPIGDMDAFNRVLHEEFGFTISL